MAKSSNGHYSEHTSSSAALYVEVCVCQKTNNKSQGANLSSSTRRGEEINGSYLRAGTPIFLSSTAQKAVFKVKLPVPGHF